MIEIRRILCPIDFSDFSRRALDHAVAIARWYDATITVLHVYPTIPAVAYAAALPTFDPVFLTSADREGLIREMRRFIDSETAPGIRIETTVREGNAVSGILDESRAMSADLLIVGTHGRSGFERLFLGSVTERLLHQSSCPVLTVPRLHPDAVPVGPVLFNSILCPVDFSECSMHALNYAMSVAQEADGALTVLHVMPNEVDFLPGLPTDGGVDGRLSIAEYFSRREANVRRQLEEAVPDTVATYCNVETTMRRGKPAHEILRLSDERHSELIVMGVQGRGAADLTLFGSTTQQVIRQAACPVMTIRGR